MFFFLSTFVKFIQGLKNDNSFSKISEIEAINWFFSFCQRHLFPDSK